MCSFLLAVWFGREPGHFGYATLCLIADLHENFSVERKEYVDTRPEFNESEMVIDIGIVARTGICHDTAGNCSGYLAHQDIMSLGSTDDNGGTFVFSARLGKIGREETAVVMTHKEHFAIYRKPVGMNIKYGHE